MGDDRIREHKEHLETVRLGREELVRQIKESQETIERSLDLLRRVDDTFRRQEKWDRQI
jgi:hypothetical protein